MNPHMICILDRSAGESRYILIHSGRERRWCPMYASCCFTQASQCKIRRNTNQSFVRSILQGCDSRKKRETCAFSLISQQAPTIRIIISRVVAIKTTTKACFLVDLWELHQVPFLTTMLCVRHPDVSLATTLVFLQGIASSGAVAKVMNLGVGHLAWTLQYSERM